MVKSAFAEAPAPKGAGRSEKRPFEQFLEADTDLWGGAGF